MDYEPVPKKNLEISEKNRFIFPLRENFKNLEFKKGENFKNLEFKKEILSEEKKYKSFTNESNSKNIILRDLRDRFPRLEEPELINFQRTLHRFADLYPQVGEVEIPRFLDRDQVARIEETVDGLTAVRQAFSSTPQEELDSLLSKVERSLTEPGGPERGKLIGVLFSSPESTTFATKIQANGIKVDQLPDLFFNDGIFSLVSVMLEHPEKYRMQLGVILSQVDLEKIPEDLRKKLKPIMSGLEFSLRTEHGNWFLCGEAEPRLIRSMEEGSSIAIGEREDPYFLVKFRGKMSALCLQDFTTQDGRVFVRGNWYSPTDVTRNDLKQAFDEGKGRITLQKGSWALMRPVKSYQGKNEEEIIAEALVYARSLPDVYPNDQITTKGMTSGVRRSEFRIRSVEEG